MKKLGIVALESSHVDAFCRILNLEDEEWHVPGARVVALCPQDNPPERVAELRGKYGVDRVVSTPEELVPLVDAALMLGRDGGRHAAQALPFLQAGKPCFVDKPLALNVEDADTMLRAAEASGAPLMSCSAIRYSLELEAARDRLAALGTIRHCSLCGPGELFFYGVHLADLLVSLMGSGVQAVADLREAMADLVTVSYGAGRTAALQVLRGAAVGFHVQLVGTEGRFETEIADAHFYRACMAAFAQMLKTGQEPIPHEEMSVVVAVLVAADRSARQGGRPVRLAEVFPERPAF